MTDSRPRTPSEALQELQRVANIPERESGPIIQRSDPMEAQAVCEILNAATRGENIDSSAGPVKAEYLATLARMNEWYQEELKIRLVNSALRKHKPQTPS